MKQGRAAIPSHQKLQRKCRIKRRWAKRNKNGASSWASWKRILKHSWGSRINSSPAFSSNLWDEKMKMYKCWKQTWVSPLASYQILISLNPKQCACKFSKDHNLVRFSLTGCLSTLDRISAQIISTICACKDCATLGVKLKGKITLLLPWTTFKQLWSSIMNNHQSEIVKAQIRPTASTWQSSQTSLKISKHTRKRKIICRGRLRMTKRRRQSIHQ